mmetsp:Transcript_36299/g.84917  ORF Transcript_36299/g.84917 Transcript_36299/m.84917 type:complete len:102 (-) Transcript_36299:106-411(-)|eukprot:CAMPEP_0113298496 /NCGR_PEP_ID=MMETSP0010_2-20120614/916_1 /TAXON_ID=216773 ORGANISM="Corethron hystrix, Strain 308" /NCGR_SAMPLE_ID=MMETSP0010_2 /ASSEMBLY_ACC=CAM_ASM_000155 /LENGTH=101 /DNA_ID=CAMNT_0000151559 /DNA_START=114 /DNA_END=419 /DNA_ORIENTATION=+ /assembly_acc=CAM_ASM_000155
MAESTTGPTQCELTERVSAMEKRVETRLTRDAIRDEQAKMLERLRKIREAMVSQGGSNALGGKEMQELRDENDALRKQCQKQEYRILHLVRSLETAENSNK